jgi:hypothetical protein
VRKACSNYLTPDKLSEPGEQKLKLSVGLHTVLQIGQPQVCNNRYNCYYASILQGYSVSILFGFIHCTLNTSFVLSSGATYPSVIIKFFKVLLCFETVIKVCFSTSTCVFLASFYRLLAVLNLLIL